MLNPVNITPIKLPQVKIELPKTGISILLAANSSDIDAIPATKTNTAKLLVNLLEINHFAKISFTITIFQYTIISILLHSEKCYLIARVRPRIDKAGREGRRLCS